jgi:methyl-accepting chemotaxis protein
MKSLSMNMKIYAVMGILILVAVVISLISLNKLTGMNLRINDIVDISAEKVKLGARINQDLLSISRAEKNIILAKTQEEMDEFAAEIKQNSEEMQTRRSQLRELVDQAGKAKLDEFAVKWDKYLEVNDQVRTFARLNSNARAKDLSTGKGREAYEKSESLIKAIAVKNDESVTNATKLADDAATRVLLGARLVQDLLRTHRAEKNVILEDTQAAMQRYVSDHKNYIASAQKAKTKLNNMVTQSGRSYFDNFETAYDNFTNLSNEILSLALAGNSFEAKTLSSGNGRKAYENAEQSLVRLVDFNDAENTKASKDANNSARLALLSARVIQDMLAVHRAEKSLIGENTQKGMAIYAKAIKAAKEGMDLKISEMQGLASAEGKTNLASFDKAWTIFTKLDDEVRELSRENGNTKAFVLASGTGRALVDECEALIKAIVNVNDKSMVNDKIASDKNFAAAKWMLILVSIIGIVVASALGFFILRDITKKLAAVVDSLNEGAEQVASASGQVSTSSQSLAEGASEQAASIEETSSSMEEMSSMTKQNAQSAIQGDSLMKETIKIIKTADNSMSQLTVSMDDISKASEETSKIIKTIDEIAFQTNLLALNAAVEAARAGEAGAGFAVVADEVRNLAMRAADAAKDTAELIEGTVKKVNGGAELVTTTNNAFNQVAESSNKVGEIVAEISSASEEQSNGIEQVNIAITEMDKVVQQNAANAEESASASEEMNAQAEQMKSSVGDLLAIIKGSTNNSHNTNISTSNQVHYTHQAPKKMTHPKAKVIGHTKEVRPDQVIPFDEEDESFKDF